jgi:hypothetical protein
MTTEPVDLLLSDDDLDDVIARMGRGEVGLLLELPRAHAEQTLAYAIPKIFQWLADIEKRVRVQ